MNIETRARASNRKRVRQTGLDISVQHLLPKVPKMSNPQQQRQSQFVDLSHTILSGNHGPDDVATGSGTGLSGTHEEVINREAREETSRETNVEQGCLEDRVKKMVQIEMAEVKKSIERLTQCMADWSKITAQERRAVVINSQVDQPTNSSSSTNNASNTSERINIRLNSQGSSDNNINNGYMILPATNGTVPVQNFEIPRIRVDKLGIVFDGSPQHISIDDFIFRLEHLQRHYQIPWNEVLRDFHLLVSGPAKEWYWLYIRTHGVIEWPGLKHALMAQYQTTRSNFEIMRDLVERKQQPGESVDNFFHVMCQMRSRLIQPIPEYDLIKIIKRNVKESIGRIVYPIAVSSVEQLRLECNEAERNFPRREIRQMPFPTKPNRHVSEVYYNEEEETNGSIQEEDPEEICAINIKPQQRRQPVVCWNCRQQGHLFMDCTSLERTLFCYKCGRPNVITPKCPNCQSGNQQQSLGTKGDPSSSNNQTPRLQ